MYLAKSIDCGELLRLQGFDRDGMKNPFLLMFSFSGQIVELFPFWLSVSQTLGLERFFRQRTAFSFQKTFSLKP